MPASVRKFFAPEAAPQRDLFMRRIRKAPPAPEFALHAMVADVLDRWLSPGWIFTHIPSGELRDKVTAAKLKRMGVKAGWPDLLLLGPDGRPHCLELKRRGRCLSDTQVLFATWCDQHGVPFDCCDNFDDALARLKAWGALRVSVTA